MLERSLPPTSGTTTSTDPTRPDTSYRPRLTNSPPPCMTPTPARCSAPGSSVA
jgi:hypothetical protein